MNRFIDKSVFCLAFFIVSCIHTSHAASMTYDMRISVSCQAEFAALNQSLKSAIKDGRKSILVDFVPGVYEIRDQHLVITKDFQNVDVTIHGNGSRLVGIRTKCSGTLSPEQVYTRNDQIVDCWGSVVQSPAKVEVVDKARKICRVKRVNGVSAKAGDIIQFSQWYLSPEYEVSSVAGEYIYFIAKDLTYYEQYCEDRCQAIGEIGLDYYWDKDPEVRNYQKKTFIQQIEIANKLNLPISIHCRDGLEDCLNILKNHKANRGGIMHCYAGSVEMADEFVKLGFLLGFGGTTTFKNAVRPKEVVASIPSTAYVLETDAPYLTPEPYRGQPNHSKYLYLVRNKIAELRNITPEQVEKETTENFKRVFDL